MEMTSPVLAVRDNQQGDVMIPDTDEVVPPRLPPAADLPDAADSPCRDSWRHRMSPNNGQFARGDGEPGVGAFVRPWAGGAGDDMRPANAPIVPGVSTC
jgi:hypothetical protein